MGREPRKRAWIGHKKYYFSGFWECDQANTVLYPSLGILTTEHSGYHCAMGGVWAEQSYEYEFVPHPYLQALTMSTMTGSSDASVSSSSFTSSTSLSSS